MSVRVLIQGIPQILRKIEPASLYGHALKETIAATKEYGEALLHKRVPKGPEGKIEAAISSRMDSHEVPLWAAVEIPHLPTDDKGFRYGGALQGSVRIPYKYRSGRSKGKPTKGWWSKTRGSMRYYLQNKLKKVLGQIEQNWKR